MTRSRVVEGQRPEQVELLAGNLNPTETGWPCRTRPSSTRSIPAAGDLGNGNQTRAAEPAIFLLDPALLMCSVLAGDAVERVEPESR